MPHSSLNLSKDLDVLLELKWAFVKKMAFANFEDFFFI